MLMFNVKNDFEALAALPNPQSETNVEVVGGEHVYRALGSSDSAWTCKHSEAILISPGPNVSKGCRKILLAYRGISARSVGNVDKTDLASGGVRVTSKHLTFAWRPASRHWLRRVIQGAFCKATSDAPIKMKKCQILRCDADVTSNAD
jgi:hypothetical protein